MPGWMSVGEDGSNVLFVYLCDFFPGMAKGSVGDCTQNIETEFVSGVDITC